MTFFENYHFVVKRIIFIIYFVVSSIAVYDDVDIDKLKVYNTGHIGTDYNINQLGYINKPKINTTEALRNGYLHFADCIQKRVQPRTNLQRARKILSWVL